MNIGLSPDRVVDAIASAMPNLDVAERTEEQVKMIDRAAVKVDASDSGDLGCGGGGCFAVAAPEP